MVLPPLASSGWTPPHMLHVWNIYQHSFHKWPSHVGKYTIQYYTWSIWAQEAKKKRKKKGKKWPLPPPPARVLGPQMPVFFPLISRTIQHGNDTPRDSHEFPWPWQCHFTRRYYVYLYRWCMHILLQSLSPPRKGWISSNQVQTFEITSHQVLVSRSHPTSLHSRMWSSCTFA